MTITEDFVKEQLTQVIDPEVGLNIIDMGLVYQIQTEDGNIHVLMTLTTQGCPAGEYITGSATNALASIEGVGEIEVELVWEPAWTPDRIDPDALERLQAGEY